MADLQALQRAIYQNKVDRGFNVTDVGKEIVLMVEELGELARAYKNSDKQPAPNVSHREEMVDAVGDLLVYCLGLCEMLQVDAGEVVADIVERNRTRTHTGWM